MTLLFINYHRTGSRSEGDDAYVLTHDEFAHQMQVLVASGIPVADPRQLDIVSDKHSVVVTFDDGYKSDLVNARQLASMGFSAMFFISTANIGAEGYLDPDEVRELERLGMVVGSHSHHHKRLNTLQSEEMRAELLLSKQILEQNLGHAVNAIAFPGGGYNKEVVTAAAIIGFRYLLTTDWGVCKMDVNLGSQLINRNNILRGMPDDEFMRLITLKSQRSRRTKFLVKQFVRTLLPKGLYRSIRNRIG